MLQSKTVSEQVIWNTFVMGALMGVGKEAGSASSIPPPQLVGGATIPYRLVSATRTAFRRCGLQLGDSQTSWWSHRPQPSRPLNCTCLGEYLYELGQPGLRGDFLFPYKYNPVQIRSHLKLSEPTCLRNLSLSVPWCMSSMCDTHFRKGIARRDYEFVLWGDVENRSQATQKNYTHFRRVLMADLRALLKVMRAERELRESSPMALDL